MCSAEIQSLNLEKNLNQFYIYRSRLPVILLVCLYPINVKTAEQICPFLWRQLTWLEGRWKLTWLEGRWKLTWLEGRWKRKGFALKKCRQLQYLKIQEFKPKDLWKSLFTVCKFMNKTTHTKERSVYTNSESYNFRLRS